MVRRTEALVVDASVAAKWQLRDEQDADTAVELLQQFLDGRVSLLAPGHIRYEVPASITSASLRTPSRLTVVQAEAAIAAFLDLDLPTIDDTAVLEAAFRLTQQLHIAYYDAVHIALSHRVALPFITADNRLYQRIRHLPGVLWLAAWRATP